MLDHELETLLLCSFRYALGRRTYAVSMVVKIILDNQELLSEGLKKLMLKEIELALATDRAGMDCDRKEWVKLRDEIL